MTHFSPARNTFIEKVELIASALGESIYGDLPPDPSNSDSQAHNDRARLLRNGLVILQFNTLENYIKERTKEILSGINGSTVNFNNLPEKLKNAVLVDLIKPIDFMLKFQDNKQEFMQKISAMMASTAKTGYTLPQYCFFHGKSNIDTNDVENAILAFGIDKPWENISSVGSELGFSGVFPKEKFTQLSQTRHHAAHTGNADVTLVDLQSNMTSIKCIGFSFDILITQALWLINRPDISFYSPDKKFKASQIRYRWLEMKGVKWIDLEKKKTRASKSDTNKEIVKAHSLQKASAECSFVVERNSLKQIVNFFTS